MKVYVVENNDGVLIAICLRKRSADLIAEKIGQVRWHEVWKVTSINVDEVDPVMLAGSDSYRKMMRKLEEQPKPKSET